MTVRSACISVWIISIPSINRVAAWTIGAQNMLQALLITMLEPTKKLQAAEAEGDYTTRLALQEESKSLFRLGRWG